jgi:hypothetical protein
MAPPWPGLTSTIMLRPGSVNTMSAAPLVCVAQQRDKMSEGRPGRQRARMCVSAKHQRVLKSSRWLAAAHAALPSDRLCRQSMAAHLAASVAPCTAMPTSAFLSAGASLTPSPVMPTRCLRPWQRQGGAEGSIAARYEAPWHAAGGTSYWPTRDRALRGVGTLQGGGLAATPPHRGQGAKGRIHNTLCRPWLSWQGASYLHCPPLAPAPSPCPHVAPRTALSWPAAPARAAPTCRISTISNLCSGKTSAKPSAPSTRSSTVSQPSTRPLPALA